VCYFVLVASPLTLTEVRSMLPPGLAADLAPAADQRALKALHPPAQTVARILVGACSCDLVIEREPGSDEAHLRGRYFRLGVPRNQVITALERHRRGGPRRGESLASRQNALAAFVAEHARNAGPTLFYLQFSADAASLGLRSAGPPPASLTVADVRARPAAWLPEGRPVVVNR
jgi:hypothetical protein